MPIKNTCKRSKSGKGEGGGPSGAINFPLYVECRERVKSGRADAAELRSERQRPPPSGPYGRRLHTLGPICLPTACTARPPHLLGHNLHGPAQVAVKTFSHPWCLSHLPT